MSARGLEWFLARLYTDEHLRARFLDRPQAVARAAGLGERDVTALACIDRDGLVLAADSYARKRASREP